MKLRNKKTGEILEAHEIGLIDKCAYLKIFRAGDYGTKQYNSLAELNKEWEDYEEPEEVWYIDWKGDIRSADINDEWECEKQIGNYFETKEEAEKAVEKLKAWKRLKDKGVVEVIKINFRNCCIEEGKKIKFEMYSGDEQTLKDLDLLFCPEENS